jgi:CHAT domain-containing protein/Tfp pilus assembly protein PilF
MFTREYSSPGRACLLACAILTGPGFSLFVQERNDALLPAEVRSLIDAGGYQDAEGAARLLVAATRTETGPQSEATATATDLLVEALLINGRGAHEGTRKLAESALRTQERLLKSDDVELLPSLRNLAKVRMIAGTVKESQTLFERALAIQQRARGLEDLVTAEALDDIGRAQLQSGRYDDAQVSLDRALRIKETRLGPSDVRISRTLQILALLHQNRGNYSSARLLLERSLAIRERFGPKHPEMIDTLNLFGSQVWFEGGDPQVERRFYLRALAIGENALRPDHPLIAITLRNLASSARDIGDFAEAENLRERALSIAEDNFGLFHSEVGGYVNDLANISILRGDYVRARVLYERALEIAEGNHESDDALATCLYNLGNVHAYLGDFREARLRLDRAAAIWQRVFGREHPYVARTWNVLGGLLLDEKRYAEARTMFERALKIRERSLGPDHHDVSQTLADLATTLQHLGLAARAKELSARSVAIWEHADARNSPTFAQILTRHGKLQVAQGDLGAARQSYERALAIRARVLGISHPEYAETQEGLAIALAGMGDSTEAIEAALQSEETGRQHLRTTLRSLPERQSLTYAAARPRGLDLAMSLAATDVPAITRVFDALVRSRALVLDEMAARQRLRTEASGDLAPLWTVLTSARQRLANLVVRGPSDQRPEQYLRLVEDARREKELAERALADKSATFRNERLREEIGLDAVRRALPLGSALVAFVRYDRTVIVDKPPTASAAAQGRRLRIVPSYMAFVAHSDRPDVSMVPLGAAASLDALVAKWHTETTGILRASSSAEAERTYRVAGAALRQRLWDPIAVQLKDAINVFVVPDGALNLVTLAALPTGRTTYLIDNGPVIHYLSAERDLVTSPGQSTAGRGLLALGGAAFDDQTLFTAVRPVAKPGAPRTQSVATRGACGDLPSLHFDSLDATSREVEDVASLWTGSPVDRLQNRDASERAFKQAAPGHRVLHLATHGFFLGSDCSPVGGITRGVGGLSTAPKIRSSAGTIDNPLLLSGLALAGANSRAAAGPKDEDGILTGEEVASLNLDGVEWAVLSACDTGLGVVKVGEGVFGLRRAFQVAGVHTVIMSLWQVEDQSAIAWMRALYEGRLKKKLNTAQAVQQASLTVLRDRRATKQSTHPFYWAGFVATGDWK